MLYTGSGKFKEDMEEKLVAQVEYQEKGELDVTKRVLNVVFVINTIQKLSAVGECEDIKSRLHETDFMPVAEELDLEYEFCYEVLFGHEHSSENFK